MGVSSARSRIHQRAKEQRSPNSSRSAIGISIPRWAAILFGAAVLVCHMACSEARDVDPVGPAPGIILNSFDGRSFDGWPFDGWSFERRPFDGWRVEITPWMSGAARAQTTPVLRVPAVYEPLMQGGLALSSAAERVSMIAVRNGDRNYLIVDKAHGKIILFENGRPIFSDPALTGESLADQFPPDAWTKPWSQQRGRTYYKVTPAGRFTLSRNRDPGLGDVFDINELRAKDWVIAIHRVWLGNRSEHRDDRLRSAVDQDKHITDGCVDVDQGTIAQLLRFLPGRGMPLYILPLDESLIPRLFATRQAAFRPYGPAGLSSSIGFWPAAAPR
jgi:hypothetical protein